MNTPVTVPSTTPPLLGSSYSSTSSYLLSMDTPPSIADLPPLIEASPYMTPSPIEQQEDLVLPMHALRDGSPNATITSPISPTFSFTEDNSVADLFHRFHIMEAQDSNIKEKYETAVLPDFDFEPIPYSSHNNLGLPALHIPRRSSSPCLVTAELDYIVSPTITVTPAGSDDGHLSDHSLPSAPVPGNHHTLSNRNRTTSSAGPKRHQRSHSTTSLQTILGSNAPMPAASSSSGSNHERSVPQQRQPIRRSSSNSTRPFVCRYCDFAFTREWNRKTHERLHDPNFVPEHQCQFCDKRFMRKHDCLRHMASVHRDEQRWWGKNAEKGKKFWAISWLLGRDPLTDLPWPAAALACRCLPHQKLFCKM